MATRYHFGINADLQREVQLESMKHLVATVTKAREAERQFAFSTNYKMLADTTSLMESHRDGRAKSALAYDAHGGDFLASAGQNYAFLADSLRKSAQLDGDAWSTLGALAATLIPLMLPCLFGDPNKCCDDTVVP